MLVFHEPPEASSRAAQQAYRFRRTASVTRATMFHHGGTEYTEEDREGDRTTSAVTEDTVRRSGLVFDEVPEIAGVKMHRQVWEKQ